MARANPKVRGTLVDERNFWQTGELLIVNIRKFGGTTAMSDQEMDARFAEDKDVLKGMQELLLPEHKDLLWAYQQIKNEVHGWVGRNSLPHPLPCFYFIRSDRKEEMEEYLQRARERAREVAQEFADKFEEAEKAYAKAKPKLYRPEKYPRKADLLSRFEFSWKWVKELNYGGNDGLKEDIEWMKGYALLALKKSIVDRMEALGKDSITQATLDSIQNQIFDKYDRLFNGFIDNVNISEAIKDLKEYLEGTDAEMLRSSDDFKAMINAKAKEIAKSVQAIKPDKGADRALLF